MTITLTPDQLAWIDARVARGEYTSQEDGARRLIDAAIVENMLGHDDLAWAKPLVDEALVDVEAGRVSTIDEHMALIDTRLAAMKR